MRTYSVLLIFTVIVNINDLALLEGWAIALPPLGICGRPACTSFRCLSLPPLPEGSKGPAGCLGKGCLFWEPDCQETAPIKGL